MKTASVQNFAQWFCTQRSLPCHPRLGTGHKDVIAQPDEKLKYIQHLEVR